MKSYWVKIDSSTQLLVVLGGAIDSNALKNYALTKHKTEMKLVLSRLTYTAFEANISENNKNLEKILADIQKFLE